MKKELEEFKELLKSMKEVEEFRDLLYELCTVITEDAVAGVVLEVKKGDRHVFNKLINMYESLHNRLEIASEH